MFYSNLSYIIEFVSYVQPFVQGNPMQLLQIYMYTYLFVDFRKSIQFHKKMRHFFIF